jgi:hypothetical protein
MTEVFGYGIVGQSKVPAAEATQSENEGSDSEGGLHPAWKESISFNHSAPPQ